MGKVVKYCQSCDESFAEKFAFCPNCGKSMQAFEMNPLGGASNGAGKTENKKVESVSPVAPQASAKPESVNVSEKTAATVSPIVSANKPEATAKPISSQKTPVFAAAMPQTPVKETKTFAASASNGNHKSQTSNDGYRTVESRPNHKDNGAFSVTVIEEKNVRRRNLLLLGSLFLMLSTALGAMVVSLFNHPLDVASIADESGLSLFVGEEEPMQVEEEKPKKEKDTGGGGGGGGREEKTPTSQGRLATQTPEKPLISPDKSIVQKDFELKQPIATTQGNHKVTPTEGPYGDPKSKFGLSSNGMGTGGGQGSGIGTGQGSGRGTGAGSGIGSGYGGGVGNGTGNGRGDGNDSRGSEPPPPPPQPKEVVTEPFRLISKPKPAYTDAARQNQVTGVVRVRVVFLASGQIGSVTPVSSLPNGLTEQAIAAAKNITFEPQKKNGVPQTTTKVIEYSFTIY